MTKQESFIALKSELQALKDTNSLTCNQVDHGNMGGLSSQLIVTAPPQVVKWLVTWLNTEPLVAINKAKALCKVEVEKARLEAVAEANTFASTNNTSIV